MNKRRKMKKFVIFHYGFEKPTQEIMDSWNKWFAALGDKIVDPLGLESLTGYTIINAESIDAAENIAKGCPMITSVRVYEATSM
jgi:hypothetical protein